MERDWAEMAKLSYDAMQKYLYRGGRDRSLYLETYPRKEGSNPYCWNWPFSRLMSGTIDMYGLPKTGYRYKKSVLDRCLGVENFWDKRDGTGPPAYNSYVSPGFEGEKYYDDNAWIGLNLLRVYKMAGWQPCLKRAKEIFDFAVDGWDKSKDCFEGGVFWRFQHPKEPNHDRGVVSNAPNAQIGLRLFAATGEQYYLEWSKKMFGWVGDNLKDPADNLYWDKVQNDCSIDRTKWSYNQGTMAGAGILLYQIEGQKRLLWSAEETAHNALTYYTRTGYANQPPEFNAIFFRNMFLVSSETKDRFLKIRIKDALAGYAKSVWDNPDIHTGKDLFRFYNDGVTHVINQGAMVEVFAMLAWDPKEYGLLV